MADNRLRNFLIGAGIATAGAIGTKVAVDYFRNKGKEEVVDASQGDAIAASPEQVSYAVVQPSEVQTFLDTSFGEPGRYVPLREPKVFDYQDQQYMVIWAEDNKNKKKSNDGLPIYGLRPENDCQCRLYFCKNRL